jgi:phosphatidylglycerophosphate synthase
MATANAPLVLSYKTIRSDYQTHCAIEPVLVDHYAKLLSPFLTALLVRAGIIPNVVTVLMMISGIVGAAFFALPPLWAKIAGLFFIHLWYVLDCSDGEVARITQRFSRMGAEIDYTAHLVCHPLFNLAFALSLIQLHRYSTTLILFVAVISISAELMLRNLLSLHSVFDLKVGSSAVPQHSTGALVNLRQAVTRAFCLYPNFALAFPVFLVIDSRNGISVAFSYLCLHSFISALSAISGYVAWVKKIAWV